LDIKPSDRMKLRVDALRARLDEEVAELARLRAEAASARNRLQDAVVAALVDGRLQPSETDGLKSELERREAAVGASEAMTASLREQLLQSRREHLRQRKLENPGLYINLLP
jgi:hypothetical protein